MINSLSYIGQKTINNRAGLITKWTVSGDSDGRTIRLPLIESYNIYGVKYFEYNFTVSWGDGSSSVVTSWNDANASHTYASAGDYIVTIEGICDTLNFKDVPHSKNKITEVVYWGCKEKFQIKSLDSAFYGCSNLTSIGVKGTSSVSGLVYVNRTYPQNLRYFKYRYFRDCFLGCTSLTSIPEDFFKEYITRKEKFSEPNIAHFWIYNYLQGAFSGCSSLESIPPKLFRWFGAAYYNNVYLDGCFSGCSSITNTPADLLKKINVQSLEGMFSECTSLESIDGSLFNHYGVSCYSGQNMFYGCTSLTTVSSDLMKNDNNGFGNFVRIFDGMFSGCTSLVSIPHNLFRWGAIVNSFDNYTFSASGCFSGCTSLDYDNNHSFGNIRQGYKNLNFTAMFSGCTSLSMTGYWISSLCNSYEQYDYVVLTAMFAGCNKLVLSYETFEYFPVYLLSRYDTNLGSMFYRETYTGGSVGYISSIWENTTNAFVADCFGGAGNSTTSISNYADIPSAWK